jgi:hypothetical protein
MKASHAPTSVLPAKALPVAVPPQRLKTLPHGKMDLRLGVALGQNVEGTRAEMGDG